MIVIARCAKRAVAIQMECFVVRQGRTPRNDRNLRKESSGFALVLTVVLLALLVLALLALSVLSRVGADIAGSAVYQTRARQNALLGLQVALGELQQLAGDDAAVTGMAGITGVPAGSKNPARHWCGVWADNGEFRGWLASGASGPAFPALTGSDSIALLANGTLGADATDKEHARALVIPVAINNAQGDSVHYGGYAWWVGDEGVKLSAVVPDDEAPVAGGKHAIDELVAALSPTAPNLARVETYAQLAYVPATPLTPGQLQSNLHALGRTHHRVVGTTLSAGLLNVNSTSARYWRGTGATYNRFQPADQLGITLTTFANRVRDNFVAASSAGKSAAGPFLSVDAFLDSPLLDTVLQDSGVTPAEFRDAMQPWLTTRSDTFRIRAYGEAVNPADAARIESTAYAEAIVQRVPDGLSGFGRRIEITYFRWLGSDDI